VGVVGGSEDLGGATFHACEIGGLALCAMSVLDWYSLKKGPLCQFPCFSSSLGEFQYRGKAFHGSGGSLRRSSP
jgi:hypothetical protein